MPPTVAHNFHPGLHINLLPNLQTNSGHDTLQFGFLLLNLLYSGQVAFHHHWDVEIFWEGIE